MAVTGEIYQGSDMLASATKVVDHFLEESDPNYEIDDATITLNCYDEDNSDALVSGPLNVTNSGSSNDYYATIPAADTAAMTLGHNVRLEYTIDCGTDRFKKPASWARVTIPTDDL